MKKLLLILPLVGFLAACGTTRDAYERRADAERETRMATQEKILDKTPEWFNKLPSSNSAVYESGFGSSFNLSDADKYAKNDAYGKICMTAGGKTSSQTKTYSSESESSRSQTNETATKSFCPGVDMTGIEQREIKRFITPNGKINTYVLVALPTGDANILRRAKEQHRMDEQAATRSKEAFKELDKQ
jgi:hypothetical protein